MGCIRREKENTQGPKKLAHKTKGGLSIRDSRVFNQALLAHQAWRLLIKPNSLCAQVLKARYYHDGRLEGTVFSGNASPTWQATPYGLEILNKGIVWHVGKDVISVFGMIDGCLEKHCANPSPSRVRAVYDE